MKKILFLVIFAAMVLPSAMWAKTYPVLVAKVPFKFSMGKRVFEAGEYYFAVIGVGRLAVLDSRKRVLALFMTRSPETASSAKSTQLFFQKDKKIAVLTRVSLSDNVQEILDEEPVGHESRPEPISMQTLQEPGVLRGPR